MGKSQSFWKTHFKPLQARNHSQLDLMKYCNGVLSNDLFFFLSFPLTLTKIGIPTLRHIPDTAYARTLTSWNWGKKKYN